MGNNKPLSSYRLTFLDFSKELTSKPKEPIKLGIFDIWMEGYAATGEHGIAQFIGKAKGRNFQDACMRHFLREELRLRDKYDKEGEYMDTKRFDYNAYKNSYWACKLFDNEIDARKSFG